MKIKTLIKYSNFKKTHNVNDNIARLIMHLGNCEVDSFREMVNSNVIPKNTRCYKDLGVNLKEFVHCWREGSRLTNIQHSARLTAKGKEIYKILNSI